MSTKNYKRAKFIDVVKYSFGGIGSNLPFMLTLLYLSYFFTDVFGISAITVGMIMLVSRIIDAVTDPLMGMIVDHTATKWGKFRPWIMFGAPFLGISIALLFMVPNVSVGMKTIYAYVIYIGYSILSTVVNIPYHSMMNVMSDDPVQRTSLASWKQGMAIIPQLMMSVYALPLLAAFGGGTQGWAIFGILTGVLTTLSFWVCGWSGKDYDLPATKEEVESLKKVNFLKDIGLLLKNKPMLMLMIAFGTDMIAFAAGNGVNMYYFVYVLGRPDLIPTVGFIGIFAGVIMIILLPFLTKAFGKKKVYWWSTLFSIVPLTFLFFNPTPEFAVLATVTGISAFMARSPGTLGWGMLPECADYTEWKTGQRVDGLTASSLTFINKCGMAIGGALAGFLLGMVGYVANQPQTKEVIDMIVVLKYGLPIAGYICSLISMHFYEIDDKKYAEIRKDLDERRANK